MNLDKPGLSLVSVMKPKTRGASPGLGLVIGISHGSSIYYDYNNNTFIESCKHTHIAKWKRPDSFPTCPSYQLSNVLHYSYSQTWSHTGCLKRIISLGLSQTEKEMHHPEAPHSGMIGIKNQAPKKTKWFSWLVHPAASETSWGSWHSPGPAHQHCRFWLCPHSWLTQILNQKSFFQQKTTGHCPFLGGLFCFLVTGAAASAGAVSCVGVPRDCHPRGACWGMGACLQLSEEHGEQLGLRQTLSGTRFSTEGQFPWLCACWSCHSWWAHAAPCPLLQGHLSTSGAAPDRTAIAYMLSQPKTSGSRFLPCKTRMTNTSRPHKGVARLNTHVCKALTSYSPGSHRKAHKQTNLQIGALNQGEGWACAATACEGRVQPTRGKEKKPFLGT